MALHRPRHRGRRGARGRDRHGAGLHRRVRARRIRRTRLRHRRQTPSTRPMGAFTAGDPPPGDRRPPRAGPTHPLVRLRRIRPSHRTRHVLRVRRAGRPGGGDDTRATPVPRGGPGRAPRLLPVPPGPREARVAALMGIGNRRSRPSPPASCGAVRLAHRPLPRQPQPISADVVDGPPRSRSR